MIIFYGYLGRRIIFYGYLFYFFLERIKLIMEDGVVDSCNLFVFDFVFVCVCL